MALSIINNTTAIGAMNSVNAANSSLSKTIRQLSTGLRINSAADDASGLAVSEKLRAQISGLSKAAANAQDGISMLQTAEGAMGSMTSIIQRMRELAVQAGDPAYTTNDRAMLQLEVDQLKDEINRISTSTEFNTKKLLNGDAAALWSSTTNNISAVVKGTPAEGNYKITYSDPGKNAVYKSDVMDIKEGAYSYNMTANDTAIKKFSNIKNMYASDDVLDVKVTQRGTNGNKVVSSVSLIGSSNDKASKVTMTAAKQATYISAGGTSVTMAAVKSSTRTVDNSSAKLVFAESAGRTASVTIVRADGTEERIALTSAAKTITLSKGDKFTTTAAASLSAGGTNVVYYTNTAKTTVSATTSFTVEIKVTQDISKEQSSSGTAQVRVRNSETGEMSDWIDAHIVVTANNSAVLKLVNSEDLLGAAGIQGVGTANITAGSKTGAVIGFENIKFTLSDDLEKNDTVLAQVGGAIISSDQTSTVSIAIGLESSAAGTATGANYVNYKKTDLASSNYDKTTTMYTAQMDKAGNVYYGSVDVTFATMGTDGFPTTGKQTNAMVTILGEGDTASSYTQLKDIGRFINADGVNVLDNTQELTIYNGNGDSQVIYVEGSDTIEDFENKLTQALIDLGMGADVNNKNAVTVNNNLVNFVTDPTTNSNEAVKGTFVIQSARLGDISRLSFSGDQALIDALSLAKIQEEEASETHIVVTEAHTGAYVGEDTVTDGRLRGVIKGIDVIVNPDSAMNVNYNKDTRTMEFTSQSQPQIGYLHVVDNSTRAAIGANEGQVLDISIGQLDTTSLEIDDVNVVSFDNAQKSITKLDQALERLSKNRAIAGAQMNRLEYAINNLNTTRENLTASESRIRDLDIAQASSNLAAQQVLLQSATAMLAQANQLPSYAAQLLR